MAVIRALEDGFKVDTLVTFISENPYSYMFHTVNVKWTSLQAVSMGMRHIFFKTRGVKEEELNDLHSCFEILSSQGYEGVVVGAVASRYQRDRVKRIADDVGMEVYTPLWEVDQEKLLSEYLYKKIIYMIVSVSAMGLGEEHLGWIIDDEDDVDKLLHLSRKYGFNPTGEGGEYESFVIDTPRFRNPIEILEYEKRWMGDSGYIIIKNARLKI